MPESIDAVNKSVLMVGYDFPPSNRAAVQRNMTFAYHLKKIGWEVHFLSVKTKLYDFTDQGLDFDPMFEDMVTKTAAFNGRETINFRGKFLDVLSLPDEWFSWFFTALPAGLRIIKNKKPSVIWSTYPICTAHVIGNFLSKFSNVPWVADYQDPIAGLYWKSGVKGLDWSMQKVDKTTVKNANKVVLATDEAKRHYQRYYEGLVGPEKFVSIENGFNDLPIISRENNSSAPALSQYKFSMLYSGSIYGAGRDPSNLLSAISLLKEEGLLSSENFQFVIQGFAERDKTGRLIQDFNIIDLVEFKDAVGFDESIREMQNHHALVLIQGGEFNLQIPGKLYEYLAMGKPIIAICDEQGATSQKCHEIPSAHAVWSVEEIKQTIVRMIQDRDDKTLDYDIEQFSRFQKTKELQDILVEVIGKDKTS